MPFIKGVKGTAPVHHVRQPRLFQGQARAPNSDVATAGPLAPKMLCTLGKPPLAGAAANENPPPALAVLPAGWNLGAQ